MDNNAKRNGVQVAGIKAISSLKEWIDKNPDALTNLKELWTENKKMDYQLNALKIQNEKEIQLITKKYEQTREVLQMIFGERQTALNAHYATLDNALKNDDKETILASLRGISSIVSQNPLESFSEFCKVWDNKDETLYLDF